MTVNQDKSLSLKVDLLQGRILCLIVLVKLSRTSDRCRDKKYGG